VIHEYSILVIFLSLGIILFAAVSSLKFRRAVASFVRENSDSLRLRRRIRIWNKVIVIFVLLLILSRTALLLTAASDNLRNGYIAQNYILFFIFSAIFLIFWFSFSYLKKLDKYFKPETIDIYHKNLTVYIMVIALVDLFITGFLFVSGYLGIIFPSSDILSAYKYHNPESVVPFLVILAMLMLVLVTLFMLFIFKRSLHFLNQYLITFFLTLAAVIIFAVTTTASIVGWNESLQIRATLLSWQYIYLGWIYILFWGISLFSGVITILVFTIKRNFIDSSRIRFVILPLIKTGFISMLITIILTVWPVLLTFI
jgi:hypothetical protein